MMWMVRIEDVAVVDGLRVELKFTDGTTRVVDLSPYLEGPIFDELKQDPSLFQQVRVDRELGTIVWPNGADICPDVLRWDRTPAAWERESQKT
jgi:hypothetical protein